MKKLPMAPSYDDLVAKVADQELTISGLRYSLERFRCELEACREEIRARNSVL